ncbi:MAG: ferredoxin [Candidatus Lambdaproteobacteria bacterium RIFOXYD12_FULL_49_8]|uniref:Ferredoxin n=1 Tax=Candidatus Lambdaproteobacteria bacterium RIFOXYD2_FULL_50_16 TaxID=1817772 RepID=A0A1F6GFT0_9PROT|nr:MAG: ferredoxin [Candidatus Lambdaproteobacteria bacterium RIFOXYD12_FULL_49_8]OGG96971.1 MAG: ferredoxin [Candidatus Lambdaproteobacteria bacterium RIFOXYD2_FULL_50_16]
MAKELHIEQDECTSCVQCTDNLPQVFRMNDEDLAEVHNQDGATKEEIQEEIDSCPAECISWKD